MGNDNQSNQAVHGLHHVTCIAGDPQVNLDFYTTVMGMLLVKRSVNQDVPDTYHLFYADGAGTPGTDLTFFPWPSMPPGRLGVGLTVEVPFAVPEGSLSFWHRRFAQYHVEHGPVERRFGELTLPFQDAQGVRLALVEVAEPKPIVPWERSPIPPEAQVRGMHAIRMWQRDLAPTQEMLTGCLGFSLLGNDGAWARFAVEGGGSGKYIDVQQLPAERRGAWGIGSVHHVAWRVKDAPEQVALRDLLVQAGSRPTPPIDRFWFQSVYFREPGGALFELATDGPGFSRDEDSAHLGEHLILPPWLEGKRPEIEAVLPALQLQPNRLPAD